MQPEPDDGTVVFFLREPTALVTEAGLGASIQVESFPHSHHLVTCLSRLRMSTAENTDCFRTSVCGRSLRACMVSTSASQITLKLFATIKKQLKCKTLSYRNHFCPPVSSLTLPTFGPPVLEKSHNKPYIRTTKRVSRC